MTIYKTLRLTQRRFVSSLFGFTFAAAVVTVSASEILPCPVRPRKGRFADSEAPGDKFASGDLSVSKRPRRWIEEKLPEQH